ncbi:MAG: phosphate acyltransferase PlsX [Gammaproteobacteria bacterium]|nr:MAG: phosphate acyltransferase PlsX [Gammaproteobacteria bacterium]
MTERIRISLDAMGGDHGPSVVVPAALRALQAHEDIELILVGREEALKQELARTGVEAGERLHIRNATEIVAMDEPPALALKKKKDSSMRVAINLVREGEAGACVSAGNTGALMATARFVLKMLPGIDRPAITTTLPSLKGHVHMLDLGANIDSSFEQLYQFAVMGSVLATTVDGNPAPKVGLLNVGQEAIKGNDQVKAAGRLLEDSNLNYIGFVEGDDIYTGDVDVVVCDGFVGNVALKTSEGLAHMISEYLREEFMRNPVTKLLGLLALPVLRSLRRRLDTRQYNGASLLGLQGIVIKSHGGADEVAFANAIRIARLEILKNLPAQIDRQIESMLSTRQAS